MNSLAFNIDDIVYEEFSEEDIGIFKELGNKIKSKLKLESNDIKRKIAFENRKNIMESACDELEGDEEVEFQGRGRMSAIQYYSTIMFSADYYMCPMLFMDIGLSYYMFFTDKKFIIYEVDGMNEIKREFVINNEDLSKIKLKDKRNKLYLSFYAENDKYDEMRMCSSPILYYFLQNRMRILMEEEYKSELKSYIERNFEVYKI